jgi:hypothetical protein
MGNKQFLFDRRDLKTFRRALIGQRFALRRA